MAVSETDTSDCNSDSSVDSKQGERKERLFTKIIVRRLPPSMNKESFITQVSPLPDYDYMYYVKADMFLGEHAFSRAYINFKNPADIFIFKEKFDNYVFLDSKGNEYTAVVEFAPFCRIPKKRNKGRSDPKSGTIESDSVYLDFVESLNQVEESEEKPEYCFQPSPEEEKKIVNTPLLDFIKQRRIDRLKIKEEKREERRKRELERKRLKDEDRKGRKSHVSHISHTPVKIVSNTSKVVDGIDENKPEQLKIKEKKVEDYKSRIKPVKDYEKRSYSSSKDLQRPEKKSPTKLRQRNERNMAEKDARRSEYKSKREETKNRREEKEEKVIEKKVKKYSERREERKNEFKKQEAKSENGSKEEDKSKDAKLTEEKNNEKHEDKTEEKKDKRESKSQHEKSSDYKETKESSRRDKDDPRTQRRIRNKDRPAMAIYQPGMGFRSKKPVSDSAEPEKSQKSSVCSVNTDSSSTQ